MHQRKLFYIYSLVWMGTLIVMNPSQATVEPLTKKHQLGFRLGISAGDGEPANDIIIRGVYTRFRVHDSWLVGASLDFAKFDFERPTRLNFHA